MAAKMFSELKSVSKLKIFRETGPRTSAVLLCVVMGWTINWIPQMTFEMFKVNGSPYAFNIHTPEEQILGHFQCTISFF